MSLIDSGIFQQEGFEFRPLAHREWVTPRVTSGNLERVVGLHIAAAETRAQKTGFRLMAGMHWVDVHPALPRRFLSREPESQFVLNEAERFLCTKAGKRFLKAHRPAMLLWRAKEGISACIRHLHQLSWKLPEVFHGFQIDTASNNFLFRGFNERGEPVVSIIDQNPQWHLLQPQESR